MSELLCAWTEAPENVDALKAMGLDDVAIGELAVVIVRPVLYSFVKNDRCYVVVDYCGGAMIDASCVKLQYDA